jgi:hypothetical protein
MGHVGGDAGVGQQVREPAPAVGGFEGDLDRLGSSSPKMRKNSAGALPIRLDTRT